MLQALLRMLPLQSFRATCSLILEYAASSLCGICRFLHSWMAALQLALVGVTLLALLGLLPLLYFLGHWYLAQQSPLEAWESPTRSLSRRWSSLRRDSPIVAGFRTPDASGREKAAAMFGDDVTGEHETRQSGPAAAAEDGSQEGADHQGEELQRLNRTAGRALTAEGSRGGSLGHCQVKLLPESGTCTIGTASNLDMQQSLVYAGLNLTAACT